MLYVVTLDQALTLAQNLVQRSADKQNLTGQKVIIFGVDMSSSAHINNKKKDILILGIGPTQGLEHTLTAEKMYSINYTVTKKGNFA